MIFVCFRAQVWGEQVHSELWAVSILLSIYVIFLQYCNISIYVITALATVKNIWLHFIRTFFSITVSEAYSDFVLGGAIWWNDGVPNEGANYDYDDSGGATSRFNLKAQNLSWGQTSQLMRYLQQCSILSSHLKCEIYFRQTKICHIPKQNHGCRPIENIHFFKI